MVLSISFVLLLLIGAETFEAGNLLEYFNLESMLNYDVLVCANHSDEYNKRSRQIQSPLAIIDPYFSPESCFVRGFHNSENDAVVIIVPKSEPEFYYMANQIEPKSHDHDDDEGSSDHEQRHFFLVWPYYMKSKSPKLIQPILAQISSNSFTIATNVFVIFPRENSTAKLSLWEIYSIKEQVFMNAIPLSGTTIVISELLAKSVRRNDFQGTPIFVIATNDTNYAAESKYTNKSGILEFESGFAVSLLNDLKEILNFSEIALPGDWMYIANNTLMGTQADALMHEEADICIAQNVMRPDLAQHVLFLQPTYPISVILFLLEPSLGALVEIYHEPFHTSVWSLLLITVLVMAIVAQIIIKILRIYSNIWEVDVRLGTETIIWTLGTIAQQGWYFFPKALPLRILFFTASLSALIVYGAYSAALVSKLSVQVSPIKSIKDLLRYDYKFIFNRESVSLREYTKGLKSYYKIPTIIGTVMPNLGVEAMKRQTALLTYWDGIFDTYPVGNQFEFICKSVQAFPVENTRVHTGMTLKKGSPYKDIFNQKILQLKEKGFNRRYAKYYEWETQPQCLTKSKVRHEALDLRSIFSAHLFLLSAFVWAIILLGIEFILLKRQKMAIHLATKVTKQEHPTLQSDGLPPNFYIELKAEFKLKIQVKQI